MRMRRVLRIVPASKMVPLSLSFFQLAFHVQLKKERQRGRLRDVRHCVSTVARTLMEPFVEDDYFASLSSVALSDFRLDWISPISRKVF
jgi:hypothetical protein